MSTSFAKALNRTAGVCLLVTAFLWVSTGFSHPDSPPPLVQTVIDQEAERARRLEDLAAKKPLVFYRDREILRRLIDFTDLPHTEVVSVQFLPASQPNDRNLAFLTSIRPLKFLSIPSGDGIGSQGLSYLRRLPHLRAFRLRRATITFRGAKSLAECSALEQLDLAYDVFDDQALGVLQALPKLESLDLSNTNIADRELATIPSFPRLTALTLDNTRITDDCLPTLVQMQKLRRLNVRGTGLSHSGISQLRDALPNAQVAAGSSQ